MRRFYQRLRQWGRLFETRKSSPGGRIIRTEVTVERQGVTVLTGGLAAGGFQTCPLCGQKLQPEQAEQATLRLQQSLNAQGEITADGNSKAAAP